jgi:hypothetical protein
MPQWKLLPPHHSRLPTTLPDHCRVGHLKGVRGLCLPNLPSFFIHPVSYVTIYTQPLPYGWEKTYSFLTRVIRSGSDAKWQDAWNTSNKVTVVPKTGASNGYGGVISGTNGGDWPTDMLIDNLSGQRLIYDYLASWLSSVVWCLGSL